MSIDEDLQRRFDTAKNAIELESGSVVEVKDRAHRQTRQVRMLSGSAVVAVVAMLGFFALRGDANTELVTTSPSPVAVEGEVIFETDFSRDTGYRMGFTNLWNGGVNGPVEPPTGWDGVRVGAVNGEFAVVGGEGIDGSNALRISWSGQDQASMSLAKHLTGDETAGFDELFIRYRVRLPNDFMAGAGDGMLGSWGWGGLWQNTSVDASGPNGWTENRANSGYANFSFGNGIPFTSFSAVMAENSGDGMDFGGNGGPSQRVGYPMDGTEPTTKPGAFERIWDLNTTDRPGQLENNNNQQWHTIEVRVGLASTVTADDGIFEVFFDGESQGPASVLAAAGGAPERNGVPTASLGSGFNFLTFFDHVQHWNEQWDDPDVGGYIWVNDVVVSTERIGPDYTPAS